MSTPNATPDGTTSRQGAVVVFTGLAGVGKSTVARKVHELINVNQGGEIPLYASMSSLFNHHLIIDLIKAIVPRYISPTAHMRARRNLLFHALDIMAVDSDEDRIFLITAYTTMGINPERMRHNELQACVDLARARKVPCFWFHFTCGPHEHRRRLESPSRPSTKIKDYDELMRNLSMEHDRMVEPTAHNLNVRGVSPYIKTINTTDKSPGETAAEVFANIQMVLGLDRPGAATT